MAGNEMHMGYIDYAVYNLIETQNGTQGNRKSKS